MTIGVELAAIDIAWTASALAFALSMSATPGPNNAMLASSGSLWGFRRSVPHMLGVSVGFPVMIVAVAGGLGDLLLHHALALSVLRWGAMLYLVYLAWHIATASPRPVRSADRSETRGRPMSFLQAALFQWINPKAWVIALTALITLTSVSRHPSFGRALLIACMFLAVSLVSTALWTLIGVGVSRALRTSRGIRAFNIAMAGLLVVSVLLTALGVD